MNFVVGVVREGKKVREVSIQIERMTNESKGCAKSYAMKYFVFV